MAVAELEFEGLLTEEPVSQFVIVWRRLRRHKLAVAGAVVILFFIISAALASVIAPYDPIYHQERGNNNAGPFSGASDGHG